MIVNRLITKAKCFFQGHRNYSTSITMINPIVQVKQGKLKGKKENLYNGNAYYSFKGIPYAEPPVGKLRFVAPQPRKPWTGVYDVTEHGAVCPQFDMYTMQPKVALEGSPEDCLILNVYTPSLQPTSKLPVMVFIHGGGFISGSGDAELYGPEYLIQHDVILVTINYRLEVLGFLCLDTPEVPGNAGMKDQVEALRWVQDNIEKFGGDRNNVTLFGESVGGASVTYHMLSPMSKGLFHKAISQSGVCLCDWSQSKELKERSFKVGSILGNNTNDSTELLNYFRSLPVEKFTVGLTFKSLNEEEKHRGLPLYFGPVVEKTFNGVEGFLTEDPMHLLLEGKISKVPLMAGYTSHEGFVVVSRVLKYLDIINANLNYLPPRELSDRIKPELLDELGRRIRSFYIGDRDFKKSDVHALVKKDTDVLFTYNIHRFLYFYGKLCDLIYMYRLDCDTELNLMKMMTNMEDEKGAAHADDLFYIFSNNLNKEIYEGKENLKRIVDNITKMWTDFAKTGNPTPKDEGIKWQPYNIKDKKCMIINEKLSMENFVERERVSFWNKLYSEAGLPCLPKSNL